MPRGNRATERRNDGRRSRTPLGGPTPKLQVSSDLQNENKGYHLHWFNDNGSRLQDAYNNDYDFVTETVGDGDDAREVKLSKRVGTNDDGSPQVAYLMRKKQEWYDDDQKEKLKSVDETEASIKRTGSVDGGAKLHSNPQSALEDGQTQYGRVSMSRS